MSNERKRNPLGLIRPGAPDLSFRASQDGRFPVINEIKAGNDFVLVGTGMPVSRQFIENLSNPNRNSKGGN